MLVPDTRVLPACGLGVVIDEVAARVSFCVFWPEILEGTFFLRFNVVYLVLFIFK